MLKVLIVDDEYLQRDLVKASIDWKKLDMEIAGEAEDGRAAYALFCKYHPDIIIMDINIPFIDGIEVSRKIKKEKPDVQILILTAYGEFDYARAALNFGAIAFVLKPLDPVELWERLNQAKNKLTAIRHQSDSLLTLQRENLQMEKEQFLLECLSGLSEGESRIERCKRFHIPYRQKICMMDVRFPDSSDNKEQAVCLEEIEEYIKEQFVNSESIHMEKDLLFLLFGGHSAQEFQVQLYSLYRNLNEEMTHWKIAGGISEIHEDITKLPIAYREVYSIMNKAADTGSFCKYERQSWESFMKNVPYKPEELLRNLRAKDYDTVRQQIERIYNELDNGNYMRETVVYIGMDILVKITSYLMEYGIDITGELEQEHEIIAKLCNAGRNQDIQEVIILFLDNGTKLIARHAGSSGKRKAEDAKKYIDENYYRTELSLNVVAQETSVNASYLSNIFKKEFKYSLSRYIIKVRLDHAIEYMKENPGALLGEIAGEVGYTDVYYFSKSFKNYFGISPSTYRKERPSYTQAPNGTQQMADKGY